MFAICGLLLLLIRLCSGSNAGGAGGKWVSQASKAVRNAEESAPPSASKKDDQQSFNRPLIVGIAGGSGSGKTTLTQMLVDKLGKEHSTLIAHDSYYKNFNHLSLDERSTINFDSLESLDSALLRAHLMELRHNHSVQIPIYDFGSHSRRVGVSTTALPARVILVDGILIFSDPQLLDMFDLKIFVDTADDIRLIRRLQRDITERNRTMESVISQYFQTVRPMHSMLVEPSKRHADIIVPSGYGIREEAVDMVVSRLRDFVTDLV